MKAHRIAVLALLASSTSALAQTNSAQTGGPAATPADPGATAGAASSPDDIVVTAQRREERLQDVPISLTAVSGAKLAASGIDDVTQLQRLAPSLFISPSGQAANARISVRGIGSSGSAAIEPSVAAFVDGIYISRAGALLGTFYDIQRVEVLNGPQGTLFGRNASVGAISITTQAPEFNASGGGTIEYGTYNRVRVLPVFNVAASDKLAFRIAGLFDRADPYVRNELTGRKVAYSDYRGLRVSARFASGPIDWTVRGDYLRTTGDGQSNATVAADSVTPTFAANFNARTGGLAPILDDTYGQRIRQIAEGRLDDRNYGFTSDLAVKAGGYTIRSLSGYRRWDTRQFEQDLVGTGLALFGRDSPRQTNTKTQEIQLLSPANKPFNFVLGAYYLHENYDFQLRIDQGADFCRILVANLAQRAACSSGIFPAIGASGGFTSQRTQSIAGYGQATYAFAPKLALTLGGRYTNDDKSIVIRYVAPNPFLASIVTPDTKDLSISQGRFTYRVSGTYKPSTDVLIFANYSTGYKSGGFDVSSAASPTTNRVFAPETSNNIELGFKSQFLDRRVTFNTTLFRLTVNDFQLRSFNAAAASFNVRNAGSIRQQGVDFDISGRPLPGLTLGTVLTVLDSEYTSFTGAPNLPGLTGSQDLTGSRATFSPKYRGVVSADYRRPIGRSLEATLTTDLTFTGKANVGLEADNNPQNIQAAYSLLGARIGVGGVGGKFQVYLLGENLADKGYCTSRGAQTLGSAFGLLDGRGNSVQRCFVGLPRTLRVGVTSRF